MLQKVQQTGTKDNVGNVDQWSNNLRRKRGEKYTLFIIIKMLHAAHIQVVQRVKYIIMYLRVQLN